VEGEKENPMVETVRAVLDRLEKTKVEEVELPPNGTSLDLLQAVYRNNELPLPTRMRAALGAVAFEHPKLIATAVVNEGSFAELLEKRLQRMKLIEANQSNGEPVLIEHSEVIEPSTNGNKPQPQPLARIYDKRRYRRL
jgi:hypothetical protein